MLCYTVSGVCNGIKDTKNINAISEKQVKWKALNLFGFSMVEKVEPLSPNLFLANAKRVN